MQFKIAEWPEAREILAQAKVLYKSPAAGAYVHFVEHSGADIIVIAPKGSREVFVIGGGDGDSANGHGTNMHQSLRRLEAIVDGTEERTGPSECGAECDPSQELIVEG